jgi:hypothetical protein
VEFDEVLVIRQRQSPGSVWCHRCGDHVPMLTPDEAARVAGLSARLIYRGIEAGTLHFSETVRDDLLICQPSLLNVSACGRDSDEWLRWRAGPSVDGALRAEQIEAIGAATAANSGMALARSWLGGLIKPAHSKRAGLTVYLVERTLPGITLEQLAAAQRVVIEKGEEFTANGKAVRYLRSIFVPGEARCMCLFEAGSAQAVKEVNEAAEIPFTVIKEALDLTPRFE